MDHSVVVIDASRAARDVVGKMLEANVWSVIVERQGLPVGVITDRDVLRRCVGKGLALDKVNAEQIMSAPIITIDPDATLGEAMQRMVQKNVRRLYVVEGGKIIGRVTQTGLFENNLNVMLTLAALPYQH